MKNNDMPAVGVTELMALADAYAEARHALGPAKHSGATNTARKALLAALAGAAQGAEPYGWLYDWTHSGALGKPDEHFTGFTTDEAHACKHENVRAVCLASPQPPATGYNPKRDMAVALGTGIAPQPAQWPDGSNYRGGD